MVLTIDDFFNPITDKQKPVRRLINEQGKVPAIEGITYTDNFRQLGYTYVERTGMLYINFWDKEKQKNIRVLEEQITTAEQFEQYIGIADKKLAKIGY